MASQRPSLVFYLPHASRKKDARQKLLLFDARWLMVALFEKVVWFRISPLFHPLSVRCSRQTVYHSHCTVGYWYDTDM